MTKGNALPFPGDFHCFPMNPCGSCLSPVPVWAPRPQSREEKSLLRHPGSPPPLWTQLPARQLEPLIPQDDISQPSMEGRKLLFLPALHPGAIYLHADRAEEALEPFVNVGRSDKGDLKAEGGTRIASARG